MGKLTGAERARLGELSAKAPYLPSVARTEVEEIEFRALSERFAAEGAAAVQAEADLARWAELDAGTFNRELRREFITKFPKSRAALAQWPSGRTRPNGGGRCR